MPHDSCRSSARRQDRVWLGTLRCLWPAQVIGNVRPDWEITVYDPESVQVSTDHEGNLMRMRGVPDPHSIDLVVMQRLGMPSALRLLEWFQRQGSATVIDSDDAMWAIDPGNVAYRSWNGAPYHWKFLEQAAETVDLVTVTTDALARRYGRHGRVEVLPNRIPDACFSLESERGNYDQTVTIGWAGFTATHPGDLPVVGDAIKRVVDETGAKVRVIGDAQGASEAWGVEVEADGPYKLGPEYYRGLTHIDIGVVPLQDSAFNRAKSWLKALEFSAMGVPVVASATPDNRNLSKTIPFDLARTPNDWYEMLMALVTEPERRAQRAQEARRAAQEHHTMEGNAEAWAKSWERALARRGALVS